MHYESTRTIRSEVLDGITFTITRMTFGRRIDLMRRVRQLSAKLEYHGAGSSAGVEDRIEASLAGAEIDELYLRWGLLSIDGLLIDGRQAEPESLMLCGPELLCREIIVAIKHECSLTEEERKN